MRALVMMIAVVVAAGCNDREHAELERRNAQLQVEKTELEQNLAQLRAEMARLKAVQAALPVTTGLTAPSAGAAATRAPTADDERELQAAQDAYVRGDYAAAIRLAKKTVPALPAKAWRVVGASSCFLKDAAGAHEAYSRLGEREREFLRYVCARNAVTLD